MPKRMLRHRVIQQCARLAFGISDRDTISKKLDSPPNHQKIKNMAKGFDGYEFKSSKSDLLKSTLRDLG
jgi:hypothetical protein